MNEETKSYLDELNLKNQIQIIKALDAILEECPWKRLAREALREQLCESTEAYRRIYGGID